MIRYLLDTNIVSEPTRKEPDERVMERYAAHAGEMAIPSVVWHELVYGTRRLPEGKKRTYLEGYLRQVVAPTLPVLPYDEEAAAWHGRERARLESVGKPRPFSDGLIAAIAATRPLVLVTRNTKHFAPFDGLDIENWFAG